MRIFSFLKTVIRNVQNDNCFNNAASIAYFSLLSSVPLIFLITTVAGFITGSNLAVVKKIYVLISPYLPNMSYELWLKLTGWFARSSPSLNIATTCILLFSSMLVFNSIDRGLRDIFNDVAKKRSSFEKLFLYSFLILFLVLIVFFFMAFDIFLLFLKRYGRHEDIPILIAAAQKVRIVLPLMMSVLQVASIMLVFRLFVGKSIPAIPLFVTSLFITGMWFAAIRAFSWYVNVVPGYNVIYGSMSIFIVFVTWNYYSALIFLIGAEILKAMAVRSR